MSLQTPIARARGLGSAKEGLRHWWAQRLTAVLLVPLSVWFVYSLVSMTTMDYAGINSWLQLSPMRCVLMLLMLIALYYHAALGMQVVIEDYIQPEWQKIACIMLVKFLFCLAGLAALVAVLKMSLGF